MEDNDDEFFSDDGLDDLPPDTLLQLEQDAFYATQAEKTPQLAPGTRLNWPSRDAADYRPRTEAGSYSQPTNATLQPPAHLHTGLTNDYGALDVGELDAEVLDDGAGTTNALGQAMAFSGRRLPPQDNIPLLEEPMELEGGASYYSDMQRDYEMLTKKLQWENERSTRLETELTVAKSMTETKAGEISIIRSKQSKLAEDYERQLIALRKAMAEVVARHKEELEAVRAEGKMMATENAFLKQDLAEEALRVNQLRAKARPEVAEPPLTPRKTKVLPFRDGFDDDEILAASPSKSGRSKRTTPTVPGKKRRRMSQESPTPLHLTYQEENVGIETSMSDDMMMMDVAIEQPVSKRGAKDFQTVKQIMNHRTYPRGLPDLEVMTSMGFPSEPHRTLSDILLEEIARLDFGNYVTEHMHAITSLWSRALKEKYYQPIPLFMELTRSILVIDAPSVLDLIEQLVSVLQESVRVNAIPRFKHSPVSSQGFGQSRQTPVSELQPLVDSTEALGLLYQIACRCLSSDRLLESFWKQIPYDFVLVMLNCSQRVCDINMTLGLLTTSVRPSSFGSIQDNDQDQKDNERWIVDRAASLLSETPQPDQGQPLYARSEIFDMRLEALSFLMAVAFNPEVPTSTHGSFVIASHPIVLARLIRAMHDELDALYSFPQERYIQASLVNDLMRLIYCVIRHHPEQADLQSKLSRVPGGKQKFLVVLTRLAFSEGLVLEAGIEDETVEMAHEVLDDAVNPQEAEALLEAFPHAKLDNSAEMKE